MPAQGWVGHGVFRGRGDAAREKGIRCEVGLEGKGGRGSIQVDAEKLGSVRTSVKYACISPCSSPLLLLSTQVMHYLLTLSRPFPV